MTDEMIKVLEEIIAEITHNMNKDISGNDVEMFLQGYRCGMGESIAIIEKFMR